ncbi:hypothetical protein AAMO2058_000875100 [Amorphochlora amoebiformis]
MGAPEVFSASLVALHGVLCIVALSQYTRRIAKKHIIANTFELGIGLSGTVAYSVYAVDVRFWRTIYVMTVLSNTLVIFLGCFLIYQFAVASFNTSQMKASQQVPKYLKPFLTTSLVFVTVSSLVSALLVLITDENRYNAIRIGSLGIGLIVLLFPCMFALLNLRHYVCKTISNFNPGNSNKKSYGNSARASKQVMYTSKTDLTNTISKSPKSPRKSVEFKKSGVTMPMSKATSQNRKERQDSVTITVSKQGEYLKRLKGLRRRLTGFLIIGTSLAILAICFAIAFTYRAAKSKEKFSEFLSGERKGRRAFHDGKEPLDYAPFIPLSMAYVGMIYYIDWDLCSLWKTEIIATFKSDSSKQDTPTNHDQKQSIRPLRETFRLQTLTLKP